MDTRCFDSFVWARNQYDSSRAAIFCTHNNAATIASQLVQHLRWQLIVSYCQGKSLTSLRYHWLMEKGGIKLELSLQSSIQHSIQITLLLPKPYYDDWELDYGIREKLHIAKGSPWYCHDTTSWWKKVELSWNWVCWSLKLQPWSLL